MLDAPTIQSAYIKLLKPSKAHPNGLSPKTIKNVHGVLHKALQQAVLIGYIRFNPADACVLPRIEKSKIVPFDDDQVALFLKEARGNRFETLFVTTLFTGVREGEILGLTWDCVDFERSMITIDKQMQLHQEKGCKAYQLIPTKNDKMRTIVAAPTVMAHLKHQQKLQAQQKLMVGAAWENKHNLVFTDALGRPLMKSTVYRDFKKLASAIGRPDARFHDLRHTFAVASLRSGDDIKTIQGNLGHATASFTLDVYGHVTMQMKQASAARMETYIKTVSAI
jgi:integrase